MGCGSGGGHGGNRFLHKPNTESTSSLGVIAILPFLIGLMIFCGLIIYKIGMR